jgi:hypothetical protein
MANFAFLQSIDKELHFASNVRPCEMFNLQELFKESIITHPSQSLLKVLCVADPSISLSSRGATGTHHTLATS